MTIALGILTPDGVVVAADTQESWGYQGGAKVSGYKILSRVVRPSGRERAMASTGAGNSGLLDYVSQGLVDDFVNAKEPDAVARQFRAQVAEFYREHIFPHHVLPQQERPEVALIVGANWKSGESLLLANQFGALHKVKYHVAREMSR